MGMEKELPVSVWPEWVITEKIGEGAYGKVYKAERTERGRSFYSAVKIISIPANRGELNSVEQENQDEQAVKAYFQNVVEECIQEISMMECFRGNSYIVSVEDFKVVEYLDEIGWDIYIRMEYLTSFLDYCAGRVMTEPDVIRLGMDLCRALNYCRQLHLIHRDIKPENIFVSRFGDFKIGDFGIARELERSMGGLSKKGTYSYMAPEMYRGAEYDETVDIYSLGMVLYRLLNDNRLPFISLTKQLITYRDKEDALNRRISGEEIPAPVHASARMSAIILKACAYYPEDRYQLPKDLYDDLAGWLSGEQAGGKPEEILSGESLEPLEEVSEMDVSDTAARLAEKKKKKKQAQEKTQKEQEKGRKRSGNGMPVWVLVLVLLAVGVSLFTVIYVNLALKNYQDTVSPESAVDALEVNDSQTAQIDDFSTAIQDIKNRATAIVRELGDCMVVGGEGECVRYYDAAGKLVKAQVPPELSSHGDNEEYYYWNGSLFFVFIWNENGNELLYYDENGNLLRWIDSDGNVRDEQKNNPEYIEKQDIYLVNGKKYLDMGIHMTPAPRISASEIQARVEVEN